MLLIKLITTTTKKSVCLEEMWIPVGAIHKLGFVILFVTSMHVVPSNAEINSI